MSAKRKPTTAAEALDAIMGTPPPTTDAPFTEIRNEDAPSSATVVEDTRSVYDLDREPYIEQLATLQEQFNTVVEQRDTVNAELNVVLAQRDTLVAGATEALSALDYAIGKGLIRAGSPMDNAFAKLRAALK